MALAKEELRRARFEFGEARAIWSHRTLLLVVLFLHDIAKGRVSA